MSSSNDIEPGIQDLCTILNLTKLGETVYSCDGHAKEGLVFMGYERATIRHKPKPIITEGLAMRKGAYVSFRPYDDCRGMVEKIFAHLATETDRHVYTNTTPSYRFSFIAGDMLQIDFPHKFTEEGEIYRPIEDLDMRTNFFN